MAYNCPPNSCFRVLRFSNPNAKFASIDMGIDVDKTDPAYNAKSLDEVRVTVARFR